MSTEPFTDEILSAVIDGEAGADIVAAVAADTVASARLAQIRQAVAHVCAPVPDAAPQRRSASIAAAMAAREPTGPEVISLAAARHNTTSKTTVKSGIDLQRFALLAAAIALVVALPFALLSRSGNDSDTAASDVGTQDSGSASFDAPAERQMTPTAAADSDDAVDDSHDDVETNIETTSAPAAANESMNDAADAATTTAPASDHSFEADAALGEITRVNSIEVLADLIRIQAIAPTLTSKQAIETVLEAGFSPACVESLGVIDTTSLALAILDEDGSNPRLLILSFADDESVTTLDAEDCAQLR